LPRRAAHEFVRQDHTDPAVTVDLANPLDDPASPPLTTDTHPHCGVPRRGAALFPADARTTAAGIRDRIAHHAQYANLYSKVELTTRTGLARWTGEAGDAAGARDQFAALLPIEERVLGAEHPDALTTRAGLARWTGEGSP